MQTTSALHGSRSPLMLKHITKKTRYSQPLSWQSWVFFRLSYKRKLLGILNSGCSLFKRLSQNMPNLNSPLSWLFSLFITEKHISGRYFSCHKQICLWPIPKKKSKRRVYLYAPHHYRANGGMVSSRLASTMYDTPCFGFSRILTQFVTNNGFSGHDSFNLLFC